MQVCPNCGGELSFDIATQKLKCPFCEGLFDPAAFTAGAAAEEQHYTSTEPVQAAEDQTLDVVTQSGQAEELRQDLQSPDVTADPQAAPTQYFDVVEYTCPQCGGTLYSTENSVNGFCSYCGSNHMLSARMAKMPSPKGVIPFQISKEQCKQAYLNKVKKSFFAPKELKDPKYLENFRGIYMPYWVYDIDYNAPVNMTGTRSYRRGNYVYTEHYKCTCDVRSFYKGISFDASASFDDYFSQSIAPFDAKAMMVFTPTYMAGFYADMQDVDSGVYSEDAVAFVQKSVYDEVTRSGAFKGITLNASPQKSIHPKVNKQNGTSLAFYPVWFLAYRNKDRVAYAVVNGQTGNLACDLPVDNKKFLLLAAVLTLPIFALLLLLPTMGANTMLMIADIIALISVGLLTSTVKRVNIRDQRLDDKGFQSKNSGVRYNEIRQAQQKKAAKEKSSGGTFAIIITVLFLVLRFGVPFLSLLVEMLGSGLMGLAIAAMAIIFFILGIKQVKASAKGGGPLMVGYIAILATVLLSALILLANPADDLAFYGSEVLVLISIVISQIFAMKEYNLLTTRPLPQLNRKGGDTSAPV